MSAIVAQYDLKNLVINNADFLTENQQKQLANEIKNMLVMNKINKTNNSLNPDYDPNLPLLTMDEIVAITKEDRDPKIRNYAK